MEYNVMFVEDLIQNVVLFEGFNEEIFNTQEIELRNPISEMVSEIILKKLDAIVIDYCLNQKNKEIKYNGADLARELEKKIPNFPIFILTSYDEKAEDAIDDVNKIYDKDDYFSNREKLNGRIISQIKKYKKSLQEIEFELESLIEKSKKSSLSLEEEERIIYLDSLIESSLLTDFKMHDSLKKTTIEAKLDVLINGTKKVVRVLDGS